MSGIRCGAGVLRTHFAITVGATAVRQERDDRFKAGRSQLFLPSGGFAAGFAKLPVECDGFSGLAGKRLFGARYPPRQRCQSGVGIEFGRLPSKNLQPSLLTPAVRRRMLQISGASDLLSKMLSARSLDKICPSHKRHGLRNAQSYLDFATEAIVKI